MKEFKRPAIRFSLDGKKIRAEITNTSLHQEDFDKQATEFAGRIILAYGLAKGRYFRLTRITVQTRGDGERIVPDVICKFRGKWQDSVSIMSKDAEGNVIRDSEKEDRELAWKIINRDEKDDTLKGVLEYYRLALEGQYVLPIAGNLYMAMEELKAKFKGWDKVSDALKPFNSRLTHTHIGRKVKQRLNEGRHAYLQNGKKADELSPNELKQQKQWVREVILAYVEWLKENEK